jgi:hypothetical protein
MSLLMWVRHMAEGVVSMYCIVGFVNSLTSAIIRIITAMGG